MKVRNQICNSAIYLLVAILCCLGRSASFSFAQQSKTLAPVKVFILAGQSNMEGQAVIDLDHEKYYNGGRGNLEHVMRHSPLKDSYKHLKDKDGKWVVRNDVFVRFKVKDKVKKGRLDFGFTGYSDRHHFGPELQFGHVVGDNVEEPVLLIKTAWGGKSLFKDFRPPSSGGTTGKYYEQMISEVREGLDAAEKEFPDFNGRKLEIAGFVWFQGWNDMFDDEARKEYEDNLVNLIKDIRAEFKNDKLPVVVGELGNGGDIAGDKMKQLRAAQKKATERKELGDNVIFVSTTDFARPAKESPNVGHGHHWFGNAESYFLVGDALGNAMLKLLAAPDLSN